MPHLLTARSFNISYLSALLLLSNYVPVTLYSHSLGSHIRLCNQASCTFLNSDSILLRPLPFSTAPPSPIPGSRNFSINKGIRNIPRERHHLWERPAVCVARRPSLVLLGTGQQQYQQHSNGSIECSIGCRFGSVLDCVIHTCRLCQVPCPFAESPRGPQENTVW